MDGIAKKEVPTFIPQTIEQIRKSVVSWVDTRADLLILAYTQTISNLRTKMPASQFKESAPYLTKTLGRSTEYLLVPEWRTNTGEIHYHGIILVKDKVKWFKETLPALKSLGFEKIKNIDWIEKWIDYIVKEAEVANRILKLPMPITDRVVTIDKPTPE